MNKSEARKAWIQFMVAAMTFGRPVITARDEADKALALLNERFPTPPSNWQEDQP